MKKTLILSFFLVCGCASIKSVPTPAYRTQINVEEAGLAMVQVVDGQKKMVKELFRDKAVDKGLLDVPWDGTDADGKAVGEGNYRVVVTVHHWKLEALGNFGGLGASQGRFVNPKGLSAANQGVRVTVAVADTGNNRIQLFTDSGSFLQEISQFGLGDERLNQPTDVDWDGQIITVCDSQNRRLARFDSTGAFLGQVNQLTGFPTSPSNPIHLDFQDPVNIQREGGSFWVSDPGYGLIELMTNTGGLVQQMGQTVSLGNDGPFIKWIGGDIWFKSGRERVVRIDTNGNDLGDLKVVPAFQSVNGFGLSPKGFVVISDSAQGLLYLFDGEGKCFQTLPSGNCRKPGGMSILDDHLFVIDEDQNKVFHYRLEEDGPETDTQPFILTKPSTSNAP